MHLIEDIYPLSPMQEGMLFHSLYGAESGLYVVQLSCVFRGALDLGIFARAWQRVVDRHPILRTSFHWEEEERALQVVHRQVPVPLTCEDWRGIAGAEQERRLAKLLAESRVRGFALDQAPLFRMLLLRTAEREHRFVFTFHHILLDGWSMSPLLEEFFAFYQAFSVGHDLDLPLSRPFGDYVELLQKRDPHAAEAYWRERMAGFTTPTPLGVDRPTGLKLDPAVDDCFAERRSEVPQKTYDALRRVARQLRCTVNTLAQGAWALLLSGYSGERDVVYGTTVSGRPADLPGMERMVGLFINTLPLRVRISPRARLRAWLGELQAQQAEASHYDYTPLADIQTWSGLPGGTPLFESLFAFESTPAMPESQAPGDSQALELLDFRYVQRVNYPLTMVLYPSDRLELHVLYDRRRFDTETAQRLLGHYGALLESMTADPERRLGDLDLLTTRERQQLVVEWNATATPFPTEECLPALVEAWAARTPDALAASFQGEALTYGELNRRANQLAHYLRRGGAGPETTVALCLERSLHLIVGALAVLKTGAAYVPLDPTHPPERLAFMLEDSRALFLLTQDALRPRLPDAGPPSLCLDGEWIWVEGAPEDNLDVPITGRQLAYVIYTSGSTGEPKGVQVEHRGLLNLVLLYGRAFGLTPADRATQVAGVGFDAVVFEVWPCLAAGASVHVIDDETRAEPDRLRDWLSAERITVCFLPTPLAEAVLQLEWPGTTSLRLLLTGGDRLHDPPRPGLPFALYNTYGPTENTVMATSCLVLPSAPTPPPAPPPIGRPIANVETYVLDAELRPVPVGVVGELYIGGASLARGYLGRPDLTARQFVPHPFSAEPGARLYRSGDLVRYRPGGDGELEFVGRVDHQVKIRGLRIELGEIEATLMRHPAVKEAAVLARDDGAEGRHKRLVGYVVPRPGHAPGADLLRAALGETLPEHMVPSAFVFLDHLPLTPNGKVDRRALQALEIRDDRSGEAHVAPRTTIERALAAIWEERLKVEQVSVHDNFFHLGGDSIVSIQIVARAHAQGLPLTPRLIFEHPTIAELAAKLAALLEAQPATRGTSQDAVTGPVPLTPIQQWLFEQDSALWRDFHQAVMLQVQPPFSPENVEQALQHLLEHHDALRMRFTRPDDTWEQVHQDVGERIAFETLEVPQDKDGEAAAITAAVHRAETHLDVSQGPLVRALLFRSGEGRPGRLFIAIHHLVVDGVSWRVLIEDLQLAYRQLQAGQRVLLPPKTTSFKAWAERLVSYAGEMDLERERRYWLAPARAQVKALPIEPIEPVEPDPVDPVDLGGPDAAAAGDVVTVGLSAAETQALLHEVPAAYNTQVNDVLLAALALALNRWTGGQRFLVELEGHGREPIDDALDVSRTVGWFTTSFPVLLDLTEGTSPGSALSAIKEQLRAIPQHGLGYGLLRYLHPNRTLARELAAMTPAEVSFNYLGQLDAPAASEGPLVPLYEERGEAAPADSSTAPSPALTTGRFLIEITGQVTGGELAFRWIYRPSRHRRATIERLASSFKDALGHLIAHCRAPDAGGYT
ncbi:MAG TPA: amino acid adenylation domain-containing protein, partial [Polyangia bacterium]|nr:amino acid adenylation domain-containing protein [Polyangia bacterium]